MKAQREDNPAGQWALPGHADPSMSVLSQADADIRRRDSEGAV